MLHPSPQNMDPFRAVGLQVSHGVIQQLVVREKVVNGVP